MSHKFAICNSAHFIPTKSKPIYVSLPTVFRHYFIWTVPLQMFFPPVLSTPQCGMSCSSHLLLTANYRSYRLVHCGNAHCGPSTATILTSVCRRRGQQPCWQASLISVKSIQVRVAWHWHQNNRHLRRYERGVGRTSAAWGSMSAQSAVASSSSRGI